MQYKKTNIYNTIMSWTPTEKDAEKVKFLRQMELSLRDEARRKKKELSEIEEQNEFANYVLNFFETEKL